MWNDGGEERKGISGPERKVFRTLRSSLAWKQCKQPLSKYKKQTEHLKQMLITIKLLNGIMQGHPAIRCYVVAYLCR
jgi:hypothetical protein